MKPQAVDSVVFSVRCRYRSATGRQCRLFAADADSGFCPQHLAQHGQKESADLSSALMKYAQGFQTAQGINYSLGILYRLAAKNEISSRRAAVLAYIGSLLLRTLPAIDADNKAGIADPTKNWNPPPPEPDPKKKPS